MATQKKKPKKKRILCRHLDALWRKAVMLRYGGKCMICGAGPEGLNAHHIIDRRNGRIRHNTDNGALLCPSHHKFSVEKSAHCNPLWFTDELRAARGIFWWNFLKEVAVMAVHWRDKPEAIRDGLLTEIEKYES